MAVINLFENCLCICFKLWSVGGVELWSVRERRVCVCVCVCVCVSLSLSL